MAQVKGRNDISWDEKVTYDNQYVDDFKKYGILCDLKIIFDTIFKVSNKENICEQKADTSMTDEEPAKAEEAEIIRLAHLQD